MDSINAGVVCSLGRGCVSEVVKVMSLMPCTVENFTLCTTILWLSMLARFEANE